MSVNTKGQRTGTLTSTPAPKVPVATAQKDAGQGVVGPPAPVVTPPVSQDRFESKGGGPRRTSSAPTKVTLLTGASPSAAPIPTVKALPASQVATNGNALAAMTPRSRANMLSGLGVELRQAQGMPRGTERDKRVADTQSAIKRVLDNTDGVQFKATLNAAALNKSLGFITETAGLDNMIQAGKVRGMNVNDVLASSDTVKHRGLTTYETQRIRENFENTLDPDTVRFRFTTGVQTQGATAMVLGNTINVDPSSSKWGFAPGTTQPKNPRDAKSYNEVLLAHEPTHVWSYQHQGSKYALNSVTDQTRAINETGDRSGAYGYRPDKKSYFQYGEEQRAMIVQDYVAAQNAIKRGEATVRVGGGQPQNVKPRDYIKKIKPFIEEMRSQGPGQPNPPGDPHGVACTMVNGMPQDGIAGALGEHADMLMSEVGRLSMEGLKSGEPLKMAAGAVGVAGAVVVSVLPRSQNANGSSGGGSDILDQAGIPRGLGVEHAGANVGAKFGYEAGLTHKRVEMNAGYQGQVAGVDVNAQADARLGLDGKLQSVNARVAAERGVTSVAVDGSARFTPELNYGTVGLDAAHGNYSLSARGDATWNSAGIQSATLQGRFDAPQLSLSGQANFGPQLRFEMADVDATARIGQTNIYGRAVILPQGVDSVEGGVGTRVGDARLTVNGGASQLTTFDPRIHGGLSLTSPHVGFSLSGSAAPASRDKTIMLGLSIPLP